MAQDNSQPIPEKGIALAENDRANDSGVVSRRASIILFGIVVILLGLVAGIILNAFGKLPPQIVQIAIGLGALIAAISTVLALLQALGFFQQKPEPPHSLTWIWERANKVVVVPSSVFTVAILTLAVVLVPSIRPGLPSLPNPYPPNSGSLAVSDPLHDNSKSYGWDITPTLYGSCDFGGGAYHVIASVVGSYHRCGAQNMGSFSNFAYEVQMSILGGDCGGVIFRGDFASYRYYYFQICADGSFDYSIYTRQGTPAKTLPGSNPNINGGLNQPNLLAVVALDTSITIYVNHEAIYHIQDSTYSQGQIGVAAENVNAPSTEVAFSNLNIWKL